MINNAVEEIKKEIEKVDQKYRIAVDNIISEYNRENEIKKDYSTRQIYELMQNADDCYVSSDSNPTVDIKFSLKDNLLIVQNTGKPFTVDGVRSLLYTNDSSKYKDTIGYKGLGFRSVLNWANNISIYTKDFNLHFSKQRAVEMLNKYKGIAGLERSEKLDSIEHVAILSSPEVDNDLAKKKKYLEDGYVTSIVLCCESEHLDNIKSQLLELRFNELLFLKHIQNVFIELPDGVKRTIISGKYDYGTHEECIIQEEGKEPTTWRIWRDGDKKTLPNSDKKYELVIAYSYDENIRKECREKGVLYSYFKTEVKMPFPFLVHGTFDLTSERNNLVKENKNNAQLLDILIDFIIDVGLKIKGESPQSSYIPLEFVLPSGDASFLNDNYGFSLKLKERIKKHKLFPTINNTYISLDDGPYYFDNEFGQLLNKETFNTLLLNCHNPSISRFIRECNISRYYFSDFCNLVVKNADEYISNGSNAKIVRLYCDEYDGYATYGPFILVDSDNNRIEDRRYKVFSSPKVTFSTLPSWSKLRFLNKKLETELIKEFDDGRRNILKELEIFNVVEYSFEKVAGELKRQSSSDVEKTKDFLRWLYANRNIVDKYESAMASLDVNVISRDGRIVPCSKCYLGNEYGNALGEEILIGSETEISFIAKKEDLGFSDIDDSLFKDFLIATGLKLYPKIETLSLGADEKKTFLEYNSKVFKEVKTNWEPCSIDLVKRCSYVEIKAEGIKGLRNILNNCSFSSIICWLLNDKNVGERIASNRDLSDESQVTFRPPSKQSPRTFKKDFMVSWIKTILMDTEWIKTKSGIKTNVFNCVNEDYSLSPIIEAISIPYDSIRNTLHRRTDKDADALFERLGVRSDISELPKEQIYEILFQIGENNVDSVVTKKIYTKLNRAFEAKEVDDLIINNDKYEEFKQKGKVLAVKNNEYLYEECKKVYYVDNKVLSNDILKTYPTLALGRRAGKDKIAKLFCVEPIEDSIQVGISSKTLHPMNEEFMEFYRTRLPYLYCARVSKDKTYSEKKRLIDTKVYLVSDATIQYKFKDWTGTNKLGKFEGLMSGEEEAYIQVPISFSNFNDLLSEMEFKTSLADIITMITKVDGDKDFFINILGCKDINDIERYLSDDPTLVNLAKEQFDSLLDVEQQFLLAVASVLKVDVETIKDECLSILGDFDYRHYDLDKIITLFRHFEIDVMEFNDKAYYRVDLTKYWADKFLALKNVYKDKYLLYRIEQLINEGGHTKEDYYQIESDYNFTDGDFSNSVNEDVAQKYEETFGVKLSELDSEEGSIQEWLDTLPNKEVAEETHAEEKTPKEPKREINWQEIISELKDDVITIETSEITNEPTTESEHKQGGKPGKPAGKKYDGRANETKERNGFVAEYEVYKALVAKLGKAAVKWISGNAFRAGVIPESQCDDSKGYDLEYRDENGQHLVEIKSKQTNGNEVEFNITKNEFDTGCANKEIYEVWFVAIGEDGKPRMIRKLGRLFYFTNGESFFHNSRFTVEQSEFKIKAIAVEHDNEPSI